MIILISHQNSTFLRGLHGCNHMVLGFRCIDAIGSFSTVGYLYRFLELDLQICLDQSISIVSDCRHLSFVTCTVFIQQDHWLPQYSKCFWTVLFNTKTLNPDVDKHIPNNVNMFVNDCMFIWMFVYHYFSEVQSQPTFW